jgi:hypothetical protein
MIVSSERVLSQLETLLGALLFVHCLKKKKLTFHQTQQATLIVSRYSQSKYCVSSHSRLIAVTQYYPAIYIN